MTCWTRTTIQMLGRWRMLPKFWLWKFNLCTTNYKIWWVSSIDWYWLVLISIDWYWLILSDDEFIISSKYWILSLLAFLEYWLSTRWNGCIPSLFPTLLESLRSTTRSAQRRGLNFSWRMSAKQFDYCNKLLKLF
jgi:hypothetical protein